jgi:hypothetical protein
MRLRRFACLLLGMWIGGSIFMALVATQNFRSVDRLLEAPAAQASRQIQSMGWETARTFLRYQVSEQNRFYFEHWELAQLLLGAGLFLLLLFGTSVGRGELALSISMMLVVAVMHWLLTPNIVSLGRQIDFVAREVASPERSRFWTFHAAYSTLEIVKLLFGLGLAGMLLISTRSRRRDAGIRDQVDAVNHADHGHIDR